MKIELRESSDGGKYRLIIYSDNDQLQSNAFKLTKNELYSLFVLLRDIFPN